MMSGIALEGFILISKSLHHRMGMGADDRDAELLAGENIGRSIETGDISGSGSPDRRIDLLRPAAAEFQGRSFADRLHHARSLGSNQGLKVNDVKDCRFDQLCLCQW